ncbi:uncharacterized [Tachysurus ichikawai]
MQRCMWWGRGCKVRGYRAERHECSCADESNEPGSVQYLPNGPGVREEDVQDTLTLCCCLKNGLSKRPGKQGDKEPREGHTKTQKHVEDTKESRGMMKTTKGRMKKMQ